MIDCSKTIDYLAEKVRMTKRQKGGLCKLDCADCPLGGSNNGSNNMVSCLNFEMLYPEKAISIVQRWSDEHPQRTYLSELLKIFPNAQLGDDGTPEIICPHCLGLKDIEDCEIDPNCIECWNQPLPEKEKVK